MKAQYVIDLLKSNSNRFTPAQLEKATGSPRRARRALFLARKEGVTLEAIRDGGRAVTAYVFNGSGSLPTVTAKPVKAAKAASAKKVASAKTISKEVDAIVAKNKAPSKKSAKDVEAIKAKNLATIKAVGAKMNQDVHPVTKRPITAEQKAVLDEFAQMEREAEAEREDREFARASVREYLTKEVYAE